MLVTGRKTARNGQQTKTQKQQPTMAKETTKPVATSIYLAVAAIINDISAIPKDKRNQAQNFNFRGIDDFYNALHPIFAAHGVVCVPSVLETTFDKWQNAKGNTAFAARVKVSYKFIATDGTFIEAIGAGEAYDFGDKALNKAMAVAHKYVLAQTFLIPTAEPDADAYTYEQTVDPKGDPYAGKSLAVLEATRDEIMAANGKPEAALLGRIAELRVAAQEAAPATTAAATTAATAKETKKEKAKKEEQKKEEPKAPEEKPAPEKDLAPGAAPEGDDGFGESEPAAEAPKGPDPLAFVIEEKALKHKDFVGKKLGQLSEEEINTIHEKWALKFAAEIEKNEDKKALRDAIVAVKAMWDAQKK